MFDYWRGEINQPNEIGYYISASEEVIFYHLIGSVFPIKTEFF